MERYLVSHFRPIQCAHPDMSSDRISACTDLEFVIPSSTFIRLEMDAVIAGPTGLVPLT